MICWLVLPTAAMPLAVLNALPLCSGFVKAGIARKAELARDADCEKFYPLLVRDLHPTLQTEVVPVILSTARKCGLLLGGPDSGWWA